jgi:hypothetical protein
MSDRPTGATDERITEQIADALSGYFDFGEGMYDAEVEEAWRIGAHIARKLPGALIFEAEDVAAVWRLIDDCDRLAAKIGGGV